MGNAVMTLGYEIYEMEDRRPVGVPGHGWAPPAGRSALPLPNTQT
jgi:hypothetical protein